MTRRLAIQKPLKYMIDGYLLFLSFRRMDLNHWYGLPHQAIGATREDRRTPSWPSSLGFAVHGVLFEVRQVHCRWTQVVLPDKNHTDRDEIVFLEAEHAAGDDSSAQQWGAVAALARVARDLPLERVLPPEFRPLFSSISAEVPACPSPRRVSQQRCIRC